VRSGCPSAYDQPSASAPDANILRHYAENAGRVADGAARAVGRAPATACQHGVGICYADSGQALGPAAAAVPWADLTKIRSQNRTSASRASAQRLRNRPLTCGFFGVSDGIRTHDIQDHNLAL
jgi:hypothetical protein